MKATKQVSRVEGECARCLRLCFIALYMQTDLWFTPSAKISLVHYANQHITDQRRKICASIGILYHSRKASLMRKKASKRNKQNYL
jgi:hypothetical protein